MEVAIERSWKNALESEFEKEYFRNLTNIVKTAYKEGVVYPPPKLIFNAFSLCPIGQVKVVIIGQDPYHGEGQAHGLSFSVREGVALPPSLKNIYKEIESDTGVKVGDTGNLERWAKQGVLLLNASLTVKKGQPMSHADIGWELFTDAVIKKVSEECNGVVFMLWGKFAQSKDGLIDSKKHLILKAPHPSPFSARTGFFGCKHFSAANVYLRKNGKQEVDWS